MHNIHSLLASIKDNLVLGLLPFSALFTFLHCAHHLKDDILQPQPHVASVTAAPDTLRR